MKQYLSGTRLFTKLKMLRSGKKKKSFLMVEGITDLRLYSKLVNLEACEVVVGECKQNVMEAIHLCNKENLKGILGIVDADFSHLEEKEEMIPNLLYTDEHDLECMLVHSKGYEAILLEYADEKKCRRLEMKTGKSIQQMILENTAQVGYLRWYALQLNLGLKFSHLNFAAFIIADKDHFEIDSYKMVEEILAGSKKQKIIDKQVLLRELKKLQKEEHNLWQICCGHDLIEVFSIGLIEIFGDYNAKNLTSGQLEGSFRLAYQINYFQKTELYKKILEWEAKDKEYKVISE